MIQIDVEKCVGCGSCKMDCFISAIEIIDNIAVPGIRCLECGHCLAVCPENAINIIGYDSSEIEEYIESEKIAPGMLLTFLKSRRSIRHFYEHEVTDSDMAKIIEAGRFAPTSGNTQLLRYIVLSKNKIKEIIPEALNSLSEINENTLTSLNVPLWYSRYIPSWKGMYDLYQDKGIDALFRGAPSAVLTVGYTKSEVDGGISTSFMDLMAFSLGVGSVYLGFLSVAFAYNSELRKKIGLKDNESVLIGLGLGYHDMHFYRTVNRKRADITKIN